MNQQSPYPEGIRQVLKQQRDEIQQPPSLAVAVLKKAKLYSVKHGNLDLSSLDEIW